MLYLNDDQKRFLNQLSKANLIDCSTLSENDLKIVRFFDDEGLIDAKREEIGYFNPQTAKFNSIPGAYLFISISEKGKSYLVEATVDSVRYKHPFAVSVISLGVALLSLVLSALSILMQLG